MGTIYNSSIGEAIGSLTEDISYNLLKLIYNRIESFSKFVYYRINLSEEGIEIFLDDVDSYFVSIDKIIISSKVRTVVKISIAHKSEEIALKIFHEGYRFDKIVKSIENSIQKDLHGESI